MLKTTRLGYDGKGQRMHPQAEPTRRRPSPSSAPEPLVLEAFVPFEREISVVVARAASRRDRAPSMPAENVHRDHILHDQHRAGRHLGRDRRDSRARSPASIADALDYVGVLGVEFFVVPSERPTLLVNEIAPRVHNSGHWTEAVCVTDQFEQHIRAVCGWPLGDPTPARRRGDGQSDRRRDRRHRRPRSAPGVQPHLYGKAEARPGRKMGHINRDRAPKR